MGKIYGNRWEILQSLPEGGQAHTFLVKDAKGKGEIQYVLKRLKNINRLERFKREIEATRNLSHKNIVRLIDFDLDGETPYLVMEYCSGGSLIHADQFWQESPAVALELFKQVCEGIAYAHSQGVIHRDLKPDNIFLREKTGPAVVGDFGLCFIEEDGSRITLAEEAVGSRLFTAPELEDGKADHVTSKCDTYSLGKILYWLLSGGKKFAREKHREPEWDLKGLAPNSLLGWINIYMEHVNRLLDVMIIADPDARISVTNILTELPKVTRSVMKEFTPIDKDIKQPCRYCGYGHYVLQAKGVYEVRNFGFQSVGSPDWRIFTCNKCGHVQAFRVDLAERKDWWS